MAKLVHYVTGLDIGKKICEALGIHDATDIEIHIPLYGAVEIRVIHLMDEDKVLKIVPIIKEYRLVHKDRGQEQ